MVCIRVSSFTHSIPYLNHTKIGKFSDFYKLNCYFCGRKDRDYVYKKRRHDMRAGDGARNRGDFGDQGQRPRGLDRGRQGDKMPQRKYINGEGIYPKVWLDI